MSDPIQEVLITPLGGMIREMGESVSDAAMALSKAQLEMIEAYPEELVKAGMIPTVYHMQDVSVELQMTLHLERDTSNAVRKAWRFYGAPMNARYKNALKYDAEGASKLTMNFAPGPPPLALEREE